MKSNPDYQKKALLTEKYISDNTTPLYELEPVDPYIYRSKPSNAPKGWGELLHRLIQQKKIKNNVIYLRK